MKQFKGVGVFNKRETKALYQSFEERKEMLEENLLNINKNACTLKKLFEQKQTLMSEMYKDELLTDKLAQTWNVSLSSTQDEVNRVILRNIAIRKSVYPK